MQWRHRPLSSGWSIRKIRWNNRELSEGCQAIFDAEEILLEALFKIMLKVIYGPVLLFLLADHPFEALGELPGGVVAVVF
jgi:hypothetical protein